MASMRRNAAAKAVSAPSLKPNPAPRDAANAMAANAQQPIEPAPPAAEGSVTTNGGPWAKAAKAAMTRLTASRK